MSNFHPNEFASGLKCYFRDDFKIQKEAMALLSSIIYEINTSFSVATLSKAKSMHEISAKTVQESIDPLIPAKLRKLAFANASRDVAEYYSGLVTYKDIEQVRGFGPSIQELSRNQFNASFEKDGLEVVEKFVNVVLKKVMEGARLQVNVTADMTITENCVYLSFKEVLPKALFKCANAHAQAEVMKYASRVLKDEYKSSDYLIKKVVTAAEPVTVDYKNDIKRILEDFNSSAARGFMPCINGYLNDLCYALAEKSSQNASNSGVLTENDVIYSIDAVLPPNLKQHAFARIYHLRKDSILPLNKAPECPVEEHQMTSDQNELMDTEEDVAENSEPKTSSYLDMASQWFWPREQNQAVGKEQTESKTDENVSIGIEESAVENSKPKSSSLLDRAWGWISPTEQSQGEENVQTENETESMETEENIEK